MSCCGAKGKDKGKDKGKGKEKIKNSNIDRLPI